jgi:hypothetical protein
VRRFQASIILCCLLALNTDGAWAIPEPEPERVSLVRLIVAPEKFDGHLVQVVGFCWLAFERRGLFLSEEDASRAVYENGVWLDLDGHKELSGEYVLVEGTFNAKRFRVQGYNGAIERVKRFTVLKARPVPK